MVKKSIKIALLLIVGIVVILFFGSIISKSLTAQCGSANSQFFITKPTTGLCKDGITAVNMEITFDGWRWNCKDSDCTAHIKCKDTDGGIDLYKKGICTDTTSTSSDSCATDSVGNSILSEKYCTEEGKCDIAKDSATHQMGIRCSGGCSDGVCINVTG